MTRRLVRMLQTTLTVSVAVVALEGGPAFAADDCDWGNWRQEREMDDMAMGRGNGNGNGNLGNFNGNNRGNGVFGRSMEDGRAANCSGNGDGFNFPDHRRSYRERERRFEASRLPYRRSERRN